MNDCCKEAVDKITYEFIQIIAKLMDEIGALRKDSTND